MRRIIQRYHTIIKPEPNGWFVGWVEEIPGAISQGVRSTSAARTCGRADAHGGDPPRRSADGARPILHPGSDRDRRPRGAQPIISTRRGRTHRTPSRRDHASPMRGVGRGLPVSPRGRSRTPRPPAESWNERLVCDVPAAVAVRSLPIHTSASRPSFEDAGPFRRGGRTDRRAREARPAWRGRAWQGCGRGGTRRQGLPDAASAFMASGRAARRTGRRGGDAGDRGALDVDQALGAGVFRGRELLLQLLGGGAELVLPGEASPTAHP